MTDCFSWFAGGLLVTGIVGLCICAIVADVFVRPFIDRKD